MTGVKAAEFDGAAAKSRVGEQQRTQERLPRRASQRGRRPRWAAGKYGVGEDDRYAVAFEHHLAPARRPQPTPMSARLVRQRGARPWPMTRTRKCQLAA